ncbi:hypothetical protein CK204_27385, partial [Klebsiella pneumoniae]
MAQPALAEQAGETLEHQQSAVVVKAEGLGASAAPPGKVCRPSAGLMAQPALAEQAGETLEHQQSAVVVKAEGLGA